MRALSQDIIKNGGKIHLRCPIQEVVIEDGKVTGVKVLDKVEKFNKVISTIPLPFVPKIFPGLPVEILNQFMAIKNIAVVCVIAKLRKPVTKNFWLNVNDPDMDIPGLVEYTNLRTLGEHIVYVPFYMPGEHPKFAESDTNFTNKVRCYLKSINCQLTDLDFIDIRASRYRFAQPICTPKYLESLPLAKTPIADLWIADTSYYYPEDRGISESIGFGREIAREITLV